MSYTLTLGLIYVQFNLQDYPENINKSKSKEKGKSFIDKQPIDKFRIFWKWKWEKYNYISTPNKLPNPNLSLDSTKCKGRIKYSYKKTEKTKQKRQLKKFYFTNTNDTHCSYWFRAGIWCLKGEII